MNFVDRFDDRFPVRLANDDVGMMGEPEEVRRVPNVIQKLFGLRMLRVVVEIRVPFALLNPVILDSSDLTPLSLDRKSV